MKEDDTNPEDLAKELEPTEGGEVTELGDTDLEAVAGGDPLILAAGEGSELVQPNCGCGAANGAGSGGDCACGTASGSGA